MNMALEVFQDRTVRFIHNGDNEVWVPVNDVADAIGYDRETLRRLINRNTKLFANYCSRVKVTLEGIGNREVLCVNRYGLVALSVKVSADRIKDEIRRETIFEFQDWVVKTITKILAGEYKPGEFQPWAAKAQEHLEFAKALTQTTGVKPGIAYAAALEAAERETGRSLEVYKKLLPPAEHETGYLNATQLGQRLGISGVKANRVLASAGLLRRDGKSWRLTDTGKLYGEEFPFVRNGHSGYQIRWSEEVIDYLEELGNA